MVFQTITVLVNYSRREVAVRNQYYLLIGIHTLIQQQLHQPLFILHIAIQDSVDIFTATIDRLSSFTTNKPAKCAIEYHGDDGNVALQLG